MQIPTPREKDEQVEQRSTTRTNCRVWLPILWVLMFLTIGCSATRPAYQESDALRRISLTAGPGQLADEPYLIMAGDRLEIRFYFHDELNEDIPVRPDGRISLQLIDDVRAAGLTPFEFSRTLKQAYASHLRNPEITVMVKVFAPRKVYVGGEVNKPGLVETVDVLTAMKAIVQCGGIKDTGNIESVVVLRYRSSGDPEFIRLDLKDDLESGQSRHDVVLRPYDIVFVPKTFIATANQFMSQYVDQMIPIQRSVGVFWFSIF